MFNRTYYLERLKPYLSTIDIKGFAGMRGCGKSFLFNQIMEYLKEEDLADDSTIIYINLEFLDNEKVREREHLERYLKKKIEYEDLIYYVFLDEIQYVPEFDKVLKTLFDLFDNVSVFISSSNRFVIAKDLYRMIGINYELFYITPFSYFETCKALSTDIHNKNMLINYLKYGGLAERFACKKSSEVKKFLYSLLDSMFLRDIIWKLGICNVEGFNNIFKCLVKFLGKDFYVEKFKTAVKDAGYNYNEATVLDCLDSLSYALLVHGIQGYNVNINKPCHSVPRYYLGDLSFAYIYGFDLLNNMTSILKNLVWLELKRRGYTLYTGINGDEKIDFVAIKNNITSYYQVFETLEDGNTINKEVDKLNDFNFIGKRYLLTLDRENFSRRGVIHKNIIDFIIEGEQDFQISDEPETWVTVE